MLFGQGTQAALVSANQDRLWPQGLTVAQWETALVADSDDGSGQMLGAAHATGHTVHDDLNDSILHRHG